MTRDTTGWALLGPGEQLVPWEFARRDLRADDLAVKVTFCGVCHSDLHAIDGAAAADLPLVPGHEFVGEVVAVGDAVSRFVAGDAVAVGNIIDSCGVCASCLGERQQFCEQVPTTTYGGRDRLDGTTTRGAYASEYVVRERFVYKLPAALDPAGVAPLMCAGVTVWDPLRHWGVGPGTTVGVVGLGGLGHLAVKFAKALGARVEVFTTSPGKTKASITLGADAVVLSTDHDAMAAVGGRFDFIIDTVSAAHDPSPYLRALAPDATLCVLAIPDEPWQVDPMSLLVGRKSLASTGSGGIRSTQEMLDFAAEHGIVADVEVLPAAKVNQALTRLARNDVRYRFVLDMLDA